MNILFKINVQGASVKMSSSQSFMTYIKLGSSSAQKPIGTIYWVEAIKRVSYVTCTRKHCRGRNLKFKHFLVAKSKTLNGIQIVCNL